ncbi:sulfatase family protein [Desertivirga arenae]|uniref:sulfatase family protein n=1 Tax=Desertivirga arenae TaxID=2810309 RepID=UPI001A957653|nr:arylsulfatase [Pedobacter sp. SYSU D00823]
MIKTSYKYLFFALLASSISEALAQKSTATKPNIVLIYADDVGYGDISANGASKIKTPNLDKIAKQGLRFSNAHTSSASCTPSRYSLITGQYAWRKEGTKVAPGNASLIIDTARLTIAGLLKRAGYTSGVVGKWHLGLGPASGPDWNGEIKPGPLELGFNYSYILPATGDRVPCVYVENHHIVNLDKNDPVLVSYEAPVGNEPTGVNNPELLKVKPSRGHNQTIVNGVSRIGYMSGGKSARWVDEDIADVLTAKAKHFIQDNKQNPFFLYFATHDIHVPRIPHSRFAGKSGLGVRGDALLQLDWCAGEVLKTLDSLGLSKNTIVIFSSDNGPVLDDGYQDEAVEKLNGHKPAGPLRGGKYSIFDAGTRVPFFIKWPGVIKPGTSSDALLSQVDLFASFASLTKQKLSPADAPDSFDELQVLLGKSVKGRESLVEHAGTLALIKGEWKYIEPKDGAKVNPGARIELGNNPEAQLYNLKTDIGETNNVAMKHPEIVAELAAALKTLKENGRSR